MTWYYVNSCNLVWIPQVLGIPQESGCLLDELHEVYHQLALPPLPLHCCLRSPRNAALWRQVRARGAFHPKEALSSLRPASTKVIDLVCQRLVCSWSE